MKWGMYLNTAKPPELTEREVLANALHYAQLAEQNGYESTWVLEHHFTNYGLCGSPMVMASYVLGATKRIRCGTAINILPIEHPVRLAEQAALLDHMSEGRFILGLGRGFFDKDFTVFGVSIHDTRKVFQESYKIIRNAWKDDKVSSDTPFHKFPPVNVLPKPYTKGGPPIVVASMSPSTIEWVAQQGLPMIMQHDIEHEEKRANIELYNETAAAFGHDPSQIEHTLTLVVGVGRDGDKIRDKCRHYMHWFEDEVLRAQNIINITREQGVECYDWHLRKWREAVLKGDTPVARVVSNLIRLNPIGTPEECIKTIQHIVDLTGVSRLALAFEAAGDRAAVLESFKLFNEEVRPYIKSKSRPKEVAPRRHSAELEA
jgi:alkanal monooxygenase alpha chain